MSFLSKIFGKPKSHSQDETPLVPENTAPRDVILIAINSVVHQSGGNCATLAHETDRHMWVQLMDVTLNCHYPHDDCPDVLFPELCNHPLIAGLEAFEPGSHMTVSLTAMTPPEIADWIERYFSEVLSVDPGSSRFTLDMDDI